MLSSSESGVIRIMFDTFPFVTDPPPKLSHFKTCQIRPLQMSLIRNKKSNEINIVQRALHKEKAASTKGDGFKKFAKRSVPSCRAVPQLPAIWQHFGYAQPRF